MKLNITKNITSIKYKLSLNKKINSANESNFFSSHMFCYLRIDIFMLFFKKFCALNWF